MMKQNILLIGFMGVGKTTVSKKLSEKTGMSEVDMDAWIVEHEQKAIADIFAEEGEPYFRKIETECLKEIQKEKGRIVSCGGGVVLKDENIRIMKDGGIILLLTATAQTVYDRVKDSTDRPILNGNMNVAYISELMKRRAERYREVADLIIATDGKTVDQIVEEIMAEIV